MVGPGGLVDGEAPQVDERSPPRVQINQNGSASRVRRRGWCGASRSVSVAMPRPRSHHVQGREGVWGGAGGVVGWDDLGLLY